jgi:CHAP domain
MLRLSTLFVLVAFFATAGSAFTATKPLSQATRAITVTGRITTLGLTQLSVSGNTCSLTRKSAALAQSFDVGENVTISCLRGTLEAITLTPITNGPSHAVKDVVDLGGANSAGSGPFCSALNGGRSVCLTPGGGTQSCARVVPRGSVCFTNDPFANYSDDIGQCTWYAAGRRPDLDGIVIHNAGQWLSDAQGKVPEGTTPVVGAIAVWTNGGVGTGHVAYVSDVTDDGATVIVDEANWVPFAVTYGRAVPASQISGYIYGGPAGNGPS